ncbi:G2/mitotic-specific cyclin cdc13, putative [Rhizoctonia solani AG-3 Rhs1AP]|uniref:G2/mitotic-specific cyclin cdc13, putative n=1 Tax=Rhizoctonia solani AG-3 Rhs1AP TaxID=1086054 RepID=X8JQI2_9AGAM|nr:G2/mitotic-specific cyclin cdc13, putative [Rhizoctonia solani AG-3 Rhs1AP]
MSAPPDNSMNIDHQPLDSHESSNTVPFNVAKFNSDVCTAIKQYKESSTEKYSPFYSDKLRRDDSSILIYLIVKTFLGDSLMDVASWQTYLWDQRDSTLESALDGAYHSQHFVDILSHDAMLPQVVERARKFGITPSSSGGLHNPPTSTVFTGPYLGDAAKRLIKTLNKERAAYSGNTAVNNAYNWSISVIQSSGMGKSRMVEEAGKSVFTIPINLREAKEKPAHPPPDRRIGDFFRARFHHNDAKQQADYMILLREIFIRALELIQVHFSGLAGEDLARAWAAYLGEGQTDHEVGDHRRQFYDDVIDRATADCKKYEGTSKQLGDLEAALKTSCFRLVDHIQPGSYDTNACFMYFDEAHSLAQDVKVIHENHKHSPFQNLGNVLSRLIDHPAFFIFLSTNSNLRDYAQPVAFFSSARSVQGSQPIAPWTALPFDIHENHIVEEFKSGRMTLKSASEVDTMVCFGRPLHVLNMWYAMRQADPIKDIFHLASDKLTGNGLHVHEKDAILAALGVRVGIKFHEKDSYSIESKLVESHMRVAYSIPEHREYMHTASPSEPVLAEGAGRYINSLGRGGIRVVGPQRLSQVVEKDSFALEERGELAARLLVTAAYDAALESYYGRIEPRHNIPSYHRPIPVIDFLCALFHKRHHQSILNAKCVTRRGDVETLGQAFSKSFLFFSHFALAADSEMLSMHGLATAIVRGAALQTMNGQESIDAVIPIHMTDRETPISAETTSAINLQIKNRKGLSNCNIQRSGTIPNAKMPVISVIMELGATGKQADTLVVSKGPPPDTRSQGVDHPDDHHYEIIARGCSSELYGLTEGVESCYKVILGRGTMLQDFARDGDSESVAGLQAMKSALSGSQQRERYFGK